MFLSFLAVLLPLAFVVLEELEEPEEDMHLFCVLRSRYSCFAGTG